MNPKLILAVSGAALVPAVAVPTSISLTPNSQEALVSEEKVKDPQKDPQKDPKVHKLPKHKSLKGSPKKSTDSNDDYYMSKYQGYFLNHKENQELWQFKFDQLKDRNGRILVLNDEDEISFYITKSWDTNYEGNSSSSLNVFCGKWYKEDGSSAEDGWFFYPSTSSEFEDIDSSNLWNLCSVFEFKPKVLNGNPRLFRNIYSDTKLIGNKLKTSLVDINNNDTFWQIRQEEWKALDIKDSSYFSNKTEKTIRDLCEDAYRQEPEILRDSETAPTLDNAKKYCSLEWDF